MQSGKLRHLIIIKAPLVTTSPSGEPLTQWQEFARAYAKIKPVSGKEYFAAGQDKASITHQISTRFIKGVNAQMEIHFNGRRFNIKSVANLFERNSELEIMAVENV